MKTPNYSDDASAPLVVAQVPPNVVTPGMEDIWTCPMCTLFNPIESHTCEACCFPQLEPSPFSRGVSSYPATAPVHLVSSSDGNYKEVKDAEAYFQEESNVIKIEVIEDDEDPFAKKRRRRRRRRLRILGGATAGAVVGGVVFCGPWGAVAGGVAGGAGARYLSKRGERKKDARLAMHQLSAATVH